MTSVGLAWVILMVACVHPPRVAANTPKMDGPPVAVAVPSPGLHLAATSRTPRINRDAQLVGGYVDGPDLRGRPANTFVVLDPNSMEVASVSAPLGDEVAIRAMEARVDDYLSHGTWVPMVSAREVPPFVPHPMKDASYWLFDQLAFGAIAENRGRIWLVTKDDSVIGQPPWVELPG